MPDDRHVRLAAAVYARLVGDSGVTTLLPLYEGRPAVFTMAAPVDAPLPRVVIEGPALTASDDHLDGRRRDEVHFDIVVLTGLTGSALPLLELTDAVRRALHRQPVVLDGALVREQLVTGVVAFTDDRPIVGRLLGLGIRITW